SVTANASLSAGYDDNLLANATGSNTALSSQQQGMLTQGSGGLNYSLTGVRAQLNAGAGTTHRYYPSFAANKYIKTYNASIDGVARLLEKPNLTVHQSFSYQPYTFLSALSSPATAVPVIT